MTIEEFILTRLNEEQALKEDDSNFSMVEREMYDAIRKTVEWHKQWPILITKRATLEPVTPDFDVFNLFTYRMTQEIDWLTTQEYIKKFGEAPPSTSILRYFAKIWEYHKDYNPAWADDSCLVNGKDEVTYSKEFIKDTIRADQKELFKDMQDLVDGWRHLNPEGD